MGLGPKGIIVAAAVLFALTIGIIIVALNELDHGPVGECLDAGGCWDRENQRCEHDDQTKCDRRAGTGAFSDDGGRR